MSGISLAPQAFGELDIEFLTEDENVSHHVSKITNPPG